MPNSHVRSVTIFIVLSGLNKRTPEVESVVVDVSTWLKIVWPEVGEELAAFENYIWIICEMIATIGLEDELDSF